MKNNYHLHILKDQFGIFKYKDDKIVSRLYATDLFRALNLVLTLNNNLKRA